MHNGFGGGGTAGVGVRHGAGDGSGFEGAGAAIVIEHGAAGAGFVGDVGPAAVGMEDEMAGADGVIEPKGRRDGGYDGRLCGVEAMYEEAVPSAKCW